MNRIATTLLIVCLSSPAFSMGIQVQPPNLTYPPNYCKPNADNGLVPPGCPATAK